MPTPPANWTDHGSTLIYRNIVLANCQTKELSQQAILDASETDLVYMKFRLSVTAHIHEEDTEGFGVYTPSAGILGLPGGADPSVIAERIHSWMMQPRGDLKFLTEGHLILEARGPETLPVINNERQPVDVDDFDLARKYDVKNGPHPQSCQVTHIAGYKAYEINFTIECNLVLCDPETVLANSFTPPHPDVPNGVQNNLNVLNNRWSINETRGADLMMTRTFTGVLRVRSYTNVANCFRHLCLPAQGRGFQRRSMSFVQSPDGLTLNYTVVDKQRYASPPRPAIDWSGTHREEMHEWGQSGTSTLNLWLQGAPGTPKKQLFNAAIATMEHRIGDIRNKGEHGETLLPLNIVLIDHLDKPEITFTATIKRVPTSTETYGGIMFGLLGKLPAINANAPPEGGDEANKNDVERDDDNDNMYERDRWVNPLPYDSSSPSGMLTTILQSPCVGWHGFPSLDEETPEDTYQGDYDPVRPEPTIKYYEGEGATFDPVADDYDKTYQISSEQNDFAYTHYEIESKYTTNFGLTALPIAEELNDPNGPPGGLGPTDPRICIGRIHHPITYRDVWIKAKRVGKLPDTPQALSELVDSNGINEYLCHQEVVPQTPRLMANGQQYELGVEAHYRYILDRTPTATEKLRAGSLPWDITVKADNDVIIADTHSNTII